MNHKNFLWSKLQTIKFFSIVLASLVSRSEAIGYFFPTFGSFVDVAHWRLGDSDLLTWRNLIHWSRHGHVGFTWFGLYDVDVSSRIHLPPSRLLFLIWSNSRIYLTSMFRSFTGSYFWDLSEISDVSLDAIAEWYITSWNIEVSMVFIRSCLAFSSVKHPGANLDLGRAVSGSDPEVPFTFRDESAVELM